MSQNDGCFDFIKYTFNCTSCGNKQNVVDCVDEEYVPNNVMNYRVQMNNQMKRLQSIPKTYLYESTDNCVDEEHSVFDK